MFQAFLEGVESHRGVHQLVNTSSKALLDFYHSNALSVDTSHIIDDVQNANTRYDKLGRANFDLEKQSRVAEQSVGLYQKALQPVQQTFVDVDNFLESEPAIGLDAEKGKEELVKVEVRGDLCRLKGALSRYLATFKTKLVPSHQLNSKTIDLVLLSKAI